VRPSEEFDEQQTGPDRARLDEAKQPEPEGDAGGAEAHFHEKLGAPKRAMISAAKQEANGGPEEQPERRRPRQR